MTILLAYTQCSIWCKLWTDGEQRFKSRNFVYIKMYLKGEYELNLTKILNKEQVGKPLQIWHASPFIWIPPQRNNSDEAE